MKKLSILIIVFFVSLQLFSQSVGGFEDVVDFSTDLKQIATLVTRGAEDRIDQDKTFVIDGAVASITIADKSKENYTVIIELVSGEWASLEEVKMYTCYVFFIGPEYSSIFPARRSRRPNPKAITVNQEVIVACTLYDIWPNEKDEPIAAMAGLEIRKLP
jgi:hypothetical protein